MLWVRNTKLGIEREMTETAFKYLSEKKRGFELIRKIEEPKSEVQKEMDRLRAEKAAQQAEKADPEQNSTPTQEKKSPGRPKKEQQA